MKLIIVSDDFPEKNHQSYVFVEQLVKAFADIYVNVTVIAPQSLTKSIIRRRKLFPIYKKYTTKDNNSYEVYRPYYISAGSFKPLLRFASNNLRTAVESVLKKFKSEEVDVLYGHFWHNANTMVSYARRHSKPLFVACGEGDNAIAELLELLRPDELKNLVDSISGVICVSSENRKRVLDYKPSIHEKIVVLPNSVDKSLFHPKSKTEMRNKLGISQTDFVISFVGSFIKRKGSDRLAAAIDKISNPTIKSIFIGRILGGDDCTPNCKGIILKEQVSHDLLPEYLCASDVFCLPTLNEGCSNAIVEALSCGLPVISSDLPFNNDLLDETDSLRIDPMNIDDIKEAILKLKNNTELRERLSKGAIEKSKSLSIENRAISILDFISSKIS